MAADDSLLGRPVLSGTGELLGRVTGVEPDPWGRPRRLRFRGDGEPERDVKGEYIRAVRQDRIELKGPREGFHITPLWWPRGAGKGGAGGSGW